MSKLDQKEIAIIASIMSYNSFDNVKSVIGSTVRTHETIAVMAERFYTETKDIPAEKWEMLVSSVLDDDRIEFVQKWLSLVGTTYDLFDDCIDYEDVVVAYSTCDRVIISAAHRTT
tara:strand:- start:7249 stop:7596 length:348 start_codon:yes stop_codon:yes gene_type:complete